ncbi:MAG: hypothetical protein A7316_10620 [Candidatus Altiarchaeales archaeon WOR_SM1_86-2]|nr:MAG: hypothetical protein A7316_10620 [Candidatus Altiarchaeales archaeon WOR_SM1_86-2]
MDIKQKIRKEIEKESRINIAIYSSIEMRKSFGAKIDNRAVNDIYMELKKSFPGLTKEHVADVAAKYKNNLQKG